MNTTNVPEPSFVLPDTSAIEPLIDRYLGPGPRYTSYPTTPVWTDAFGPLDLEHALRETSNDAISLYVHVPFCERLCTYCACNREISMDHSVAEPYLAAMKSEIDRLAMLLGRTRISCQVAIGGGTPTYLSPSQLGRLLDSIDGCFPPAADAERSIEIDPRVTTNAHLETLAARGFDRLSLGVQDLAPRVQQAIRRIQSREETETATAVARRLGFRSINFDLIYGLPHQTLSSFADTLDAVVEMRPDRIALYSYAHVTWVSKQQRGFKSRDLPSAAEKIALLLSAIDRLGAAGYGFLGLDHFALPEDDLFAASRDGRLHRNFMGYTTSAGAGLLGIGPSAISELPSCYAQSERSVDGWSERLDRGRLPTMRGFALSADDLRRRWLIHRVMCQGEIDAEAYAAAWGEDLRDRIPALDARLEPFEVDGLLDRDGDRWRLTSIGRIFARPVAMTFDAYLPTATDGHRRFSQTL